MVQFCWRRALNEAAGRSSCAAALADLRICESKQGTAGSRRCIHDPCRLAQASGGGKPQDSQRAQPIHSASAATADQLKLTRRPTDGRSAPFPQKPASIRFAKPPGRINRGRWPKADLTVPGADCARKILALVRAVNRETFGGWNVLVHGEKPKREMGHGRSTFGGKATERLDAFSRFGLGTELWARACGQGRPIFIPFGDPFQPAKTRPD